jgi:hypothetical protein
VKVPVLAAMVGVPGLPATMVDGNGGRDGNGNGGNDDGASSGGDIVSTSGGIGDGGACNDSGSGPSGSVDSDG